MKITLVVQRYGKEVVGGAERLCRGVAEGLAERHDVEVLTTCARSYVTWASEYREGADVVEGVRVRRFRVERERDIEAFNRASTSLFSGPRTAADEVAWIDAQGPFCPRLVDHVHTVAEDRDALVFFTYLYYPTVHGIQANPTKSFLVPTAHDEAPFYLDAYEPVFSLPAGLIFNTRAERALVQRRFPHLRTPARVVGVGIENLDALEEAARIKWDVTEAAPAPIVLYAGRIEEGKGVGTLIDHLERFRTDSRVLPRLWLMGEPAMDVPDRDWIDVLGFVSEEEKIQRLAAATVLAAPSALESFAIVPLEAMAAGTPVLANAASLAAVEHCDSGGGGLYYSDYADFREGLQLLLGNARLRRALASRGGRYVRDRYSWPSIVRRYEEFLAADA